MQAEYEELGHLIATVHSNPILRMNALEYVHDVCGENEQGPLMSDEEASPSSSPSSATGHGSAPESAGGQGSAPSADPQ